MDLESRITDLTFKVGPEILQQKAELEQGRYKGGVTVVYSDLKNFTSLSEQIDTPEQLANVVNHYFLPILNLCRSLGATFKDPEGDAVKIMTDPVKAIILSEFINNLVKESPPIKTKKGLIKIGVHSAIASGRVFEGILGKERRKYFAIGTPFIEVNNMSRHWGQDKTLIDSETLRQVKELVEVIPEFGNYYAITNYHTEGIVFQERPEFQIPSDIDLAYLKSFFPSLYEVGKGYFGKITSLFMKLKYILDLFNQGKNPKELKEILDQSFLGTCKIVESELGGEVDKYGDIVLCNFGGISHGDDPIRAIYAGDRLINFHVKLAKELGIVINIPIGINTGTVFDGLVGPTMTVIGDPVNTSARLLALAEKELAQSKKGRITLIGSDTLKEIGDEFKVVSKGPLNDEAKLEEGREQLKGKEKATTFFSIEGIIERETKHSQNIYGREEELKQAYSLFDLADQGNGILLGIKGEAGIGKSRFSLELEDNLYERGYEIYSSQCSLYDINNPFQPLKEIIEQLTDYTKEATADLSILRLGQYFDAESLPLILEFLSLKRAEFHLTEEERKEKLRDGIINALLKQNKRAFFIHDLHLADQETRELISSLESRKKGRVVFVADYRPELTLANELELKPLSRDALLQMLNSILTSKGLKEKLTREQETYLIDKSQGNPLFLQEITKEIEVRDEKIYTDINSLAIPTTVENFILARRDKLSEEERRVLDVLSVLGDSFDIRVSDRILGERKKYVEPLIEKGWIHKEIEPDLTRLSFHHALFREVIYGTKHIMGKLLLEEKQNLHGLAALAYEEIYANNKDKVLNLLAMHFRESNLTSGNLVTRLEHPIELQIPRNLDRAIEYNLQFLSNPFLTVSERVQGNKEVIKALEKFPEDEINLFLRGLLYIAIYVDLMNSDRKKACEEIPHMERFIIDSGSQEMKFLRGKLLYFQGGISQSQKNYYDAIKKEEESIKLLNESQAFIDEAASRLYRATIEISKIELDEHKQLSVLDEIKSEVDKAVALLTSEERVLSDREKKVKKSSIAISFRLYGHLEKFRKNYAKAMHYYLNALGVYGEEFAPESIFVMLDIADFAIQCNDSPVIVRRYSEEALRGARRIGNSKLEYLALFNLGEAYLMGGDKARAVEFYDQAINLAESLGSLSEFLSEMKLKRLEIEKN